MSGAVWIEQVSGSLRKVELPELPPRGAIVRVDKVDDLMYRLVDRDGRPLLMGLSNSVEAAANLAKSRGWRPETTSVATQPRRVVAKPSSKSNQVGLGLGLD